MKSSNYWHSLNNGDTFTSNQSTTLLDKALSIGKEYFSLVIQFANLMGDSSKYIEASEIFFLVAFFDRRYITRSQVALYLSLDRFILDKSIGMLKEKGLIKSYKKGLTVNWEMPCFNTEDTAWQARILTVNAQEWYSHWEDHWTLIELINIIQNLYGIEIPKSSRRFLVKCMCLECIDGCSAPTARKVKKELLTINRTSLESLLEKKEYKSLVDMELEVGRTKRLTLSSFQKAKMALKDKGSFYGISEWERKVADRAKELYPDDYKSQCIFVYTIIVSLGYIGENSIAFDGEDKCDWGIFFKKTSKEKKELIWKNGIQKSLYELSKEIDQQA